MLIAMSFVNMALLTIWIYVNSHVFHSGATEIVECGKKFDAHKPKSSKTQSNTQIYITFDLYQ